MSELETLRAALAEELSCLWTDLQTARRAAINGQWSMHCDWLVERIKTITPLVGPTSWTELDIQLIEDGVYQRVHAEIGVDAPYDEGGVRKHRARLDASGNSADVSEQPEAAELEWHYGPTGWDPNPGGMWHTDCPAGRGEVMYDGDGWAFCMGCKAVQAPESAGPVRPDEEPTP